MTTSEVETAIQKFTDANKQGPTFDELLRAVASLTNNPADEADLQEVLQSLQSVGGVWQSNGRFIIAN